MFRFVSVLTLAAVLAVAATAEAGKRQLLGRGSHGGYAPPVQAYTAPPQPLLAVPVQPAPQMVERWVQGPARIEKRTVEVDVTVPGEWHKETVPCEPAPLAMLAAPCVPVGPLALLTPECREREHRRAKRLERRAQRKKLGIEEPEPLAELPADAPAEEPQPTPAE